MHKKGAPTETAGNSHELWLFVFNSEILRMDQGARSAGISAQSFGRPRGPRSFEETASAGSRGDDCSPRLGYLVAVISSPFRP
jgi:hypothetical protein